MSEMIATRDAYGKALVALGEQEPRIVVLDGDLSSSTKTGMFAKRFPERFFNMGIAEQNLMGTAAGLASLGKIPYASTFAIFATGRAWEQIRQSIAYAELNVKIVATHSGVTVGEDGGSHQSVEDISLMRSIPGMTVIVPADAVETEKVIQEVAKYKGPVFVRLGRMKVPVVFDNEYKFRIGKAAMIKDGTDVSIIAAGLMVAKAIEAGELLSAKGIRARIINMSTIKPIDDAIIEQAAAQTGAIVTAEEHSVIGGLGSAVAEVVVKKHPVPVEFVGVKDTFGTSGTSEELLEYFDLTASRIVTAVEQVLKRKTHG